MIHILEIYGGNLPRHVGPFATHDQAYDWALVHASNASWSVVPLAHPDRDWS